LSKSSDGKTVFSENYRISKNSPEKGYESFGTRSATCADITGDGGARVASTLAPNVSTNVAYPAERALYTPAKELCGN
jgi:hypothetical protein